MKPTSRQPQAASGGSLDVREHLGAGLEAEWRGYRKQLKRCQEHFSERTVHKSRVETRRLLATVELLGAFMPARKLGKVRLGLKEHLDALARLRDTQVQLRAMERGWGKFPAASRFAEWLQGRERKFRRATRRAVWGIKPRRLGERLEGLVAELRAGAERGGAGRAWRQVIAGVQRAFTEVVRLRRRVVATDTETIHRTRIAFKRFRYMMEVLLPLLPLQGEERRRVMQDYQVRMGAIQDVEILIAALDKFIKRTGASRAKQELRSELARRRQQLIRSYITAADQLEQFWPPPGVVRGKRAKRVSP